jgi:hypothetical protein
MNELDDFTMQEVKEVALGVKKVTAAAYDGIPVEAWKMLVTKDEETKILIKSLK